MTQRKPDYSINSIYTDRWSPRAFAADEISVEQLNRGFEAARWSPSSGNSQPSRFVYSRRGTPSFDQFIGFMNEGNQPWAKKAAALIVVISKKDFVMNGQKMNSATHSFDTGSAWMSFALQMFENGWYTHGMAGIHKDKIARAMHLPENFQVECMVAVGRIAPKEELPENYRAREIPSVRKPLENFAREGFFPTHWE